MLGELAEPRQRRALAATEREVKHARIGEMIDGALPFREAPLAWRALRRRAGVATRATGAAPVRDLEVRLERRRQHVLAELALALAPRRRGRLHARHASRHGTIDEHQRTRDRELHDRAEPLESCSDRRMLARRAPALDQSSRTAPGESFLRSADGAVALGLFARQRSSAPITGVTIASAVAPTSRNVTSTPRLDEFGFIPHLIARIFPFLPRTA